MAKIIPNTFTTYELTSEEQNAGATLTTANQHTIQNLISSAAQLKVNLTFDPDKPTAFLQEEARLNGEIRILSYLLECNDAVNPSFSL